MIVFDLQCCDGGHRFEGWFGSSEEFVDQQSRGLIACPQCGSVEIAKAPMAPNVGRKGNQLAAIPPKQGKTPVTGGQLPPQARMMMRALAAMQAEAIKDSTWVGDSFAEVSREIHYGEREAETIHGRATASQAIELIEEGIEVMPLPFPVAPPEETN